ncbi:hypothetical protein C1645_820065 [Glomus cerebriforme]|uniref:BTB domain-containing protein n=1 Tax=Glomus cerebriforme TaxID=658196 RepID=A0A397TD92_9GLOM|nr:hypothetical protein C1645_820065 [Glomus cerebriforme]
MIITLLFVSERKEFRAHSSILKGRSFYFRSAFSSKWVVKKDDIFEFEKPNINPNIFEIILKYIYTGEVDLTKNSGEKKEETLETFL